MDQSAMRAHAVEECRLQMEECEKVYTRASLYLASIPVLGAICYGILADCVDGHFLSSPGLCWISGGLAVVAMVLLFLATLPLFICVRPHRYERIPLPDALLAHGEKYRLKLFEANYPIEHHDSAVDGELSRLVTSSAAECARKIHVVNEKRQSYLSWASTFVLCAVVGLAAAGAVWIVVRTSQQQGKTHVHSSHPSGSPATTSPAAPPSTA